MTELEILHAIERATAGLRASIYDVSYVSPFPRTIEIALEDLSEAVALCRFNEGYDEWHPSFVRG